MNQRIPWTWWDLGAVILVMATSAALLILGANLFRTLTGSTAQGGVTSPLNYAASVIIYLSLIGGVWWFGARRWGWEALGWRPVTTRDLLIAPLVLLGALFAAALANVVLIQIIGPFENPQAEAITRGGALSEPQVYALLFLVAGVVPFAEELFFRGMLYPLMRQHLSPLVAIALNAALFAVVHFIPLIFPALFCLGFALAYLRERSNSIVPSMLAHTLQNSLALMAIVALQR